MLQPWQELFLFPHLGGSHGGVNSQSHPFCWAQGGGNGISIAGCASWNLPGHLWWRMTPARANDFATPVTLWVSTVACVAWEGGALDCLPKLPPCWLM